MNKILGLTVGALIALGSASAFAGSGCCAAGKAKSDAITGGNSGCADSLAKLKLTDEQKNRVNALMDNCRKATSKSECYDTMTKGLEKILTPEQFSQWKADWDKAGKSCSGKETSSKS